MVKAAVMIMKMKKVLCFILAALLLTAAVSCRGSKPTVSQKKPSAAETSSVSVATDTSTTTETETAFLDTVEEERQFETVMTIGSYPVPFGLYRYYFLSLKEEMLEENSDCFANPEGMEKLKEDTLNLCRAAAAYFNLAEQFDISLPKNVDDQYVNYVREAESIIRQRYGVSLSQWVGPYMTPSVYKIFYKLSGHLQNAVDTYILENKDRLLDLSDEAIKKAGEDYRTVKHILVKVEASRTEEEALNLAEELIMRYEKGENFDELMSEYSADYHEDNNVYTFTYGQMVEEFEKASFELEENQLSAPVKSQFGYHIILRLPLADTFADEIYPSIALENYLDRYEKEQTLSFDPLFESLDFETLN